LNLELRSKKGIAGGYDVIGFWNEANGTPQAGPKARFDEEVMLVRAFAAGFRAGMGVRWARVRFRSWASFCVRRSGLDFSRRVKSPIVGSTTIASSWFPMNRAGNISPRSRRRKQNDDWSISVVVEGRATAVRVLWENDARVRLHVKRFLRADSGRPRYTAPNEHASFLPDVRARHRRRCRRKTGEAKAAMKTRRVDKYHQQLLWLNAWAMLLALADDEEERSVSLWHPKTLPGVSITPRMNATSQARETLQQQESRDVANETWSTTSRSRSHECKTERTAERKRAMSYTICVKEAVHVFTETERRKLIRVAKMQALAACWRFASAHTGESVDFADQMVSTAIGDLVLDVPTFDQVMREAKSEWLKTGR
jgi:hypothetical protein